MFSLQSGIKLALGYEAKPEDDGVPLGTGKVDFDGNSQGAQRYAIRSLPTLLFFKDGNVLDQINGALPKADIAAKPNALLQLERAKGGPL